MIPRLSPLLFLFGLTFTRLGAAEAPAPLEPVQLAERVFSFGPTMSNSAALVGDEGVLLIDAGDSPAVAARLQAALARLTTKPVRLLVDTHWHFDHVNGNETFGAAGATILGHAAMRARMIAGRTDGAAGASSISYTNEALAAPAITFEHELSLHFAGEEIRLWHPAGPAHTDGDTVVFFRRANLVHMGDLFFNGMYPYIDVGAGGWIDGVVAGCRDVLARIDEHTIVVPGHGATTDKAHLEAYVAMLTDISARITALIRAGKTLDEVKAARPTAAYDEAWGKIFLKPDQFTELAYNGLVAHLK